MPHVRILEAVYGGDLVLDFPDEASRDIAFRLALRTIASSERTTMEAFHVRFSGWPGLPHAPETGQKLEDALTLLKTVITPENRYLQVTCGFTESTQYRIGVLGEDGGGLTLGPSWEAPAEWYDAFWASFWEAFQAIEVEIPNLQLQTVGGIRYCLQRHRISPFLDNCGICGEPPS